MTTVWPILHYDDPEGARRFLVEGVGFREAVVVRDVEGDVVHAELAWRGGGRLLLGGTKHEGGVHAGMHAGAFYLGVAAGAEPEADHDRLVTLGADVVAPPHATEFAAGGPTYAFTTRDTEGNLLTFATYRGAP